ncbi:MAG TPA: DUF1080 domain-containing protein [Verrucomicrobiota bacterium]|nr:DUF1080 domain-containing protein [Verrucomicrobiales bacterium]HRI14501.1 DUF1080 domain-containing protein [Verrucomicrobiota bacterium]
MKPSYPLLLTSALLAGCASHQPNEGTFVKTHASTDYVNQNLPHAPGADLGKLDAEGFTIIFDGTWTGWRVNENAGSWSIRDGAFRAQGDRSHNFYIGSLQPLKNFELKLEIMTEPGSNGGVYIHTKFQDSGWPWGGYETQVNQTQGDWRKSGSIYSVKDVKEDEIKTIVKDNEWYTQHVIVKDGTIKIFLNGKLVNEFVEEPGRQPGKDFERKLSSGTIALQAHDPKSVVFYKNIRVKPLD